MKNLLFNLVKQIIPDFLIFTLKRFRKKLFLTNALNLPIFESYEVGEVIKTIKEESVESVIYPKIYDYILGGRIDLKSPKINLMKYKDAIAFPLSDFIITQNSVIWHKFHNPQFSRMIPHDYDLLKVEGNILFIKKPTVYINVKVGYYLCGYNMAWSHFLVEHLPKLYYIRDLRKTLNQDLTIILRNDNDPNIREIVNTYVKSSNGIQTLELKDNEVAVCDTLFHIENTAFISDDVHYEIPAVDYVIPKFVAQSIIHNLLPDLLGTNIKISNLMEETEHKLYIGRKSNFRNILNQIEVEEFFRKKGFIIIYPETLTLHEKVNLFQQAAIVVGPGSSGFTNLIFSKPDTKVLIFINVYRCFEPYFGFLSKHFGIDITVITGNDEPTSGSVKEELNNSYTIPLSKLIPACNQIGI